MRIPSALTVSVLLLALLGGRLAAGSSAPTLLQTVPQPKPLPAEPVDKAAEARWLEGELARRPPAKAGEPVPGPLVAKGLVQPSELVGGPSALFANVGTGVGKTRRIVRIGREGQVQVLAEGRRSASALLVGSDGQVYWWEEDTLVAVSQKGGPLRALVRFANAELTSLAERGGTLYAAVRPRGALGGNGAVVAIDKKGQVRALTPGEPGPGHVAVGENLLVWTSRRLLRSMPLPDGVPMTYDEEVRGPLVPRGEFIYAPVVGSRELLRVSVDGGRTGTVVKSADIDSLVTRGSELLFTSVSIPGVVRRWDASSMEDSTPEVVARFKGERGMVALLGGQLHVLVVDGPGALGWLYRVESPAK
jgi:hypothetical protein